MHIVAYCYRDGALCRRYFLATVVVEVAYVKELMKPIKMFQPKDITYSNKLLKT